MTVGATSKAKAIAPGVLDLAHLHVVLDLDRPTIKLGSDGQEVIKACVEILDGPIDDRSRWSRRDFLIGGYNLDQDTLVFQKAEIGGGIWDLDRLSKCRLVPF